MRARDFSHGLERRRPLPAQRFDRRLAGGLPLAELRETLAREAVRRVGKHVA